MSTNGERLRSGCAATRVLFSWMGVKRQCASAQKASAADLFGADAKVLSLSKTLINTKNPKYKALTSLKAEILDYWRHLTTPYVEPGVRLLRRDTVEPFDYQMRSYANRLAEHARAFGQAFPEVLEEAREKLGDLFDADNYPTDPGALFSVGWDYPSVDPPSYLRELDPELYERESRRVAQRFDEAVRLAEEGFAAEFSKLLDHLVECLKPQPDGTQRIFRNSTVENLTEFFARFRNLNISGHPALEEMVGRAEALFRDVTPGELRNNTDLRTQIVAGVAEVSRQLEERIVTVPRRVVTRRRREITDAPAA